jgi:hypothetical protein
VLVAQHSAYVHRRAGVTSLIQADRREEVPTWPGARISAVAATRSRSRQQGALDFGAGCFAAIRNPAAHEHALEPGDQVALEQLAALSLLARWIDECTVEQGN